jgi:hypothetical protein
LPSQPRRDSQPMSGTLQTARFAINDIPGVSRQVP